MYISQYLLSTLKETPTDADVISHQLMLRAGMIRKLSSGLYIWLPTGLRVLKKIESIIREEMNNIGAIEISMPIMQPSDLWKKSHRWEKFGSELFNFIDRSKRLFVLGPTHEEVITDLIRKELNSYKQLPLIFFQIQTKFRDEIRPCFGVIRSREFLMKDAYSFHTSQKSLSKTYNKMHEVYKKIFSRIGLNFYITEAETGSIGGNISHEFLAPIQHNNVNDKFSSISLNYSKNTKSSKVTEKSFVHVEEIEKMRLVDTPNVTNINELIKQFNLTEKKIVKTLLVKAVEGENCPLIALLVRGDHKINKKKAEKLSQVAIPFTFASEKEIRSVINAGPNFLGPVNMPLPMVIDHAVAVMNNFIAGANIDGKHFFGICWGRDLAIPLIADIRDFTKKKIPIEKESSIETERNIEVGHIFQLGTKYSQIINAFIQKKDGKNQILTMGCYGIGVTRVVAAVIEQNYDEYGIIWPDNIAPFQIAILPIDMYKSSHVQELARSLYIKLREKKIDVLIDDRKERPGVMFSDIDLIGIPHTIILSKGNLNKNKIEYKYRRGNKRKLIKVDEIFEFLINIIRY